MIRFIFIALVGALVHAQNPTDNFQAGVQFYQSQKYEDAVNSFRKAAENDPNRPSIYYNWALSEYQLKNYSVAAALLRRALYLDEDFINARTALASVAKELPAFQNREPMGFFSELKADIRSYLGLNKILLIAWLCFIFSTFLFLRYVAARKSALQFETPLPRAPLLAGVFALFFIISLLFSGIKIISLRQIRATVKPATLALRTSPNPEANTIVEALSGAEVTVETIQGDWALVTLPNNTTGWAETVSLIQNSGEKKLW